MIETRVKGTGFVCNKKKNEPRLLSEAARIEVLGHIAFSPSQVTEQTDYCVNQPEKYKSFTNLIHIS